jgi:UDP-glucose 4-epimerase
MSALNKEKSLAKPKILVTGGTGYIGSHTAVELINAGYDPVIVDNLSNSKMAVLSHIKKITGKMPIFFKADIRSQAGLQKVFEKHQISAVIHFAGLKAVGESVLQPLRYYKNNIEGSLTLFSVMSCYGVKNIVFSSSASIYGDSTVIPIHENCLPSPANPYARSKLIIEQILQDIYRTDQSWRISILRYFNPVGAHESGLIGEDPQGIPNNLMPYLSQVAVGKLKRLSVFGNDYTTSDGTGVRDYIHVVDLAESHVAALKKMEKVKFKNPLVVNIGTGRGYSVLEMVRAFEKASGKKIPFEIVKRRPGDIAACYADTSLAKKLLSWQSRRDIADMCQDTWRWQSNNPHGYR